MVFHITVNLDEISDSLDTSLKFLNNLSIKSCELRMINNKNIIILENEYYDISSTEIRNKVKNKEDISGLVNKKVKKLIEKEYID